MKLSRTDLIPVLAIVAGGVIGASLSFSFLGGSRSDDVLFIAVPAVAPSVAVESAPQRTDLSPNLEVVRGSGEVSVSSYETVEVLRSEEQKAVARARALAAGTLR